MSLSCRPWKVSRLGITKVTPSSDWWRSTGPLVRAGDFITMELPDIRWFVPQVPCQRPRTPAPCSLHCRLSAENVDVGCFLGVSLLLTEVGPAPLGCGPQVPSEEGAWIFLFRKNNGIVFMVFSPFCGVLF